MGREQNFPKCSALSLLALALSCLPTFAGEDQYYRQFLSLVDTNNPYPQGGRIPLLTDTNNLDSKVIGTLNLAKLKEQDSIAGLRFGMTMEQVAANWGKPLWLWSRCFHGMPTMAYNYVQLGFEGDSLKAIRFNPDYGGQVHFDKDLSTTSPSDAWVKELGEPAARKGSDENGLLIYTSGKATMTLQFFDGKMSTVELAKPDFSPVRKFLYPKGFAEAANVFKNAPATNRFDAAATLMEMLPTTPVTSTNGPIDYKARGSRFVTYDYNKPSFVLTESEAIRLLGSPALTNSTAYSYLIQREGTNNLQTFLLIDFYGGHAVLSTIY